MSEGAAGWELAIAANSHDREKVSALIVLFLGEDKGVIACTLH